MPKQASKEGDFTYDVLEHLGVIGSYSTGWKKEVNIVEWNGNAAKVDIRDWDPAHEHMSRGITLHRAEAVALLEVLLKHYGHELRKREREQKQESVQSQDMERSVTTANPTAGGTLPPVQETQTETTQQFVQEEEVQPISD